MKAIVYEKYGQPDVLHLEEVEKPIPKENEVLIKVVAASVNSWDWDLIRGRPYLIRLESPIKPKHKTIGCDIAGRVESIGSNIKKFKPGDEVFGDISRGNWGGFAEYVCADENALALKPGTMSFDEAASIPQAAVLALQGLCDKGNIQNGQKILINGAGGGVGTFGVQIAKLYETEITCVDKGDKLDILKTLGADHVIDYTKDDFTKSGKTYDLIIDNVASRSVGDYLKALNPGGKLVVIGGKTGTIIKMVFLGKFISKIYGKYLSLLLHKPSSADLKFLSELFVDGKLKPVIGKKFKLNETAEAIRQIGAGDIIGKAIISME